MPCLVGMEDILVALIRKYVNLSRLGWPVQLFIDNLDSVWLLVQDDDNLKNFAYYLNKYLATRIENSILELDYFVDHVLLKIVSVLNESPLETYRLKDIYDSVKNKIPHNPDLINVTKKLCISVTRILENLNYSSSSSDSEEDG